MKPKNLFTVIALIITGLLAACSAATQAQPAAPAGQAATSMKNEMLKENKS